MLVKSTPKLNHSEHTELKKPMRRACKKTKIHLPSAGLLICNSLSFSLTPVRMTGREKLGGMVLPESALSVITIFGGSPSPVYPSTVALLNF